MTLDIFIPSKEDLASTSEIYDTDSPGQDFTLYSPNQKTVVINDIPFANYWQLKSPTHYVFHPMVYGRYVFKNVKKESFRKSLKELTFKAGIELPNAGIAFYYPNHYPLNRMKGPDLMYSAISQSEILTGYLKNHIIENTTTSKLLLEKIKKGLFFDYERGGVDLGVAQLELPLYHSNPEIILNGWLHSLLRLTEYSIIMNDRSVASYIEKNLKFFIENHEVWYDSKRNISRYSDTSPHKVHINKTFANQAYEIIYKAKDSLLKHYAVKPINNHNREYGPFDVGIISSSDSKDIMMLTCSGLYDTYVTSDAPFLLRVKEGGYSPIRSTPDGTGRWVELKSVQINTKHIIDFSLPDDELICGYQTNFSKKNKKNFYHMHHILSLMYLSNFSAYDNHKLNNAIREIALKWLSNNQYFMPKKYIFQDAQNVLKKINAGKILTPFENFSELKEITQLKYKNYIED